MRPAYQADDGALIVFEQGTEWRLSFVAKTKVRDAQGTVTDQETAPKRFTYLLGAGQKVNTPAQRLSALQKPVTLQALFDAFSVEVLNREFYENVAAHFYRLVGKPGLLKFSDKPTRNDQLGARTHSLVISTNLLIFKHVLKVGSMEFALRLKWGGGRGRREKRIV